MWHLAADIVLFKQFYCTNVLYNHSFDCRIAGDIFVLGFHAPVPRKNELRAPVPIS